MTTYNKHRKEIPENEIDDMKDKYKDRTIIQLSPTHYLAIKDYKHRGYLSLIHISEPTRLLSISYAVF